MSLPGPLPTGLEEQRRYGGIWVDWLDRLPSVAGSVLQDWDLTCDGEMWHGHCSLVLPVHTATGRPAVLKLALPDDESEHEHIALDRWRGRGAVRLERTDPGRRALLLERLGRTDLTDLWDEEACAIVADLYGRLHMPPMPRLRTQNSYVERWAAALKGDAAEVPMPRRLVDQALALAGDLCQEPPTALIHGDLHYENVLLGDRDGTPTWLAIDPKPTNGDPHYELEPMLNDRFDDYTAPGAFGSVRDGIRRRFHALIDGAGFEEQRARDWVIVRSVLNAHWAYADAVAADRTATPQEREHITRCITIAKAVQD